MRPSRFHGIGLARSQSHLFLWVAQEEPQISLDHMEGVLDMGMVVPGHLLLRRDLDLGDPKSWPHCVLGLALDFKDGATIPSTFHRVVLRSPRFLRHARYRCYSA